MSLATNVLKSDGRVCKGKKPVVYEALEYECGFNTTFVRSHSPQAVHELMKAAASANPTIAQYREAGSCHFFTATRDPRLAVPSKFLEENKDLCDGAKPESEVLKMYQEFINGHALQHIFETTGFLLRAFGSSSITDTLTQLFDNGGHVVLNRPSSDAPWAGCELVLLDMASASTWGDHFMKDILGSGAGPFPREQKHASRDGLCPNLSKTYESIRNFKVDWETLLEEQDNAQAIEVVKFYASRDEI